MPDLFSDLCQVRTLVRNVSHQGTQGGTGCEEVEEVVLVVVTTRSYLVVYTEAKDGARF